MTPAEITLLNTARRAVLATIRKDGSARLVPIVYAPHALMSAQPVIYSAIDEKPKSVANPHTLARVRDILKRPRVTVLVDRWSEEWSELAWLRLEGEATLLEPADESAAEHSLAVSLLRQRYPQYATQRLEVRPIIRIAVQRAVGWQASA